jgi:hypothetical protein
MISKCGAVGEMAGETEVLGENLPHSPLFYQKYHLSSNPGRSGGKPATNRLSYGTPICAWKELKTMSIENALQI